MQFYFVSYYTQFGLLRFFYQPPSKLFVAYSFTLNIKLMNRTEPLIRII